VSSEARPDLEQPMYLAVQRENMWETLSAGEERQAMTMYILGERDDGLYNFYQTIFCEIELFVWEGTFRFVIIHTYHHYHYLTDN
jgi:hypothetical protein